LRLSLIQRHLGVGAVEAHQGLSGLDELGVIGADRNYRPGDLRRDLDDVAAYVGVIGRLVIAQHLRPVEAVPERDGEHRRAHRGEQAPAARDGRGFEVIGTHGVP